MSLSRAMAVALLSGLVMGGCASNAGSDVAGSPATYIVRRDDTLYSIAWRHNVDYRDLAKWNDIGPDYPLAVGQVLVLGSREAAGASRVTSSTAPAGAAGTPSAKPPPRAGRPSPPGGAASARGAMPRPAPPAVAPETAAAGSVGAAKWFWPTQHLSPPRPVPGGGILLFGILGQDVRAAGRGRVVYTGNGIRGYGNLVIIKHGDMLLSSYAHNREVLVHEGQDVLAGQVIARMGMGPHRISALYFEIRVNGKPVDPLRYLPPAK